MIFTCSSTTAGLYWALDSVGSINKGYLNSTTLGIIQHLGIFTFNLTSKNSNLTSTATVHNVTISQTGTDIYCANTIINFNQFAEMDTLQHLTTPSFRLYSTWFTYWIISCNTN